MISDRDDVALAEWERRAFAAIQQEFAPGDPEPARGFLRRFGSTLAVFVVLIVVGAIAAVATFTWSLWLAGTGLAAMATGVALAARSVTARLNGVTLDQASR
jgi:hypothetical protein